MASPSRFLAALADRPLLLDAAMGTRLIARGLDIKRDDAALWNLSHPDDIADIHRRDLAAGADAILTNTFGANRAWLSRFDPAADIPAINRRAVELARAAAGPDRFVLGSIGPTSADDPTAEREQIESLAGVDALILETHNSNQLQYRVPRLRALTPLPLLACLAVTASRSWIASKPSAAGYRLMEFRQADGLTAEGTNCVTGMEATLAATRRLHREKSGLPLIAKPAAGLPGGPQDSPADFAAAVPRLLALGVRLLGGCCGTTEGHIAAMRSALDSPTTDH